MLCESEKGYIVVFIFMDSKEDVSKRSAFNDLSMFKLEVVIFQVHKQQTRMLPVSCFSS